MLDSLITLYKQLGGLGTAITLVIILIFIGAVYSNILIRRKYISLSEELAGFCAGQLNSFHSDMLQWITDEYKAAAAYGLTNINTISIIDTGSQAYLKLCHLGERFLKRANALLVTTGLFGTFIGLTFAVGNIGSILNNASAEAIMSTSGADTLSVLVSSFKGMAVAFVTSLFGTGFSILNMLLSNFFSAVGAKNLFQTQLEEFLDIKLAAEISEKSVNQDVQEKKDKDESAQILISAIDTFGKTVSEFSTGFTGLKTFNLDFAANIEQVKNSLSHLTNAMDKTSEALHENGIKAYKSVEAIALMTQEIAREHKRLEYLSELMIALKDKLGENKVDREAFLKAIYDIPDRLLNYQEAAVARTDKKG